MTSSLAGRPRARDVAAAILVVAAAAAHPVVALLSPAGDPLAAAGAVAPSTAVALVGLTLLARFDRRQKAVVQELGRVRLVDRDYDTTVASLLAEIRKAGLYNRQVALELGKMRQQMEEGHGNAYVSGYIDAIQGRAVAARYRDAFGNELPPT